MWTLKDKSTKRLTEAELPTDAQGNKQVGRLLQLWLEMVFTDGTNDIKVGTFVSTEDEVKSTIKQNLDRLNSQEELEAKIADGTFTHEEQVVEPTAEEKAAKEAADAWVKDYNRLKKVEGLEERATKRGKTVSTERQALIDSLADRVDTNFKPEYLDLI